MLRYPFQALSLTPFLRDRVSGEIELGSQDGKEFIESELNRSLVYHHRFFQASETRPLRGGNLGVDDSVHGKFDILSIKFGSVMELNPLPQFKPPVAFVHYLPPSGQLRDDLHGLPISGNQPVKHVQGYD